MPSKIDLLNNESLTYEDALQETFNVIHCHEELHAKNAFTAELSRQRDSIAALASHHLGLGTATDAVTVYPPEKWLSGGFNVCVPIDVQLRGGAEKKKLLMKCPMAFRIAEHKYPGSLDEKLRTEVGAYVWIQESCPSIRIPHLYGFGSSAHHFTHVSARPWYSRLLHAIRYWLSRRFYGAQPSKYVSTNASPSLPAHYMLLEFIGPETGRLPAQDWFAKLADPLCRKRLFTGLSNIILELAKVPQPKIGSFRFNNDCTISLDGRAVFAGTSILEGQGAPRTVPAGQTYTCTEPFVSDMITLLDESYRAQIAASDTETACLGQMGTRVFLRAVAHHYIKKQYRNGPFLMQLTDLNPGNFFVDDDWKISCLFDLEYISALPVENLAIPYWLSGGTISDIEGQKLAEYEKLRREFMEILREREAEYRLAWPISTIMEEMWTTKGVWFWHSLASRY
ncbi:hypothetical protein ISF_01891 [Cordyceps fumosorosea ARSEF 2679]|uniref:Aminoglycoside phosphotransferase n=1 Tax=Cordyceps fumosorosea (strain ARSEF 2679) TaxID=1081104 RepID=A0A168CGB5_CORFA|nr:hypothetical protein ISF_01891 [Cordyceps fumosorosea ARSEF 2679]OAA71340.1 hypothetical protein ISF_01891 [Cordyceps fumosorosea ARSEF 2679]